MTQRILDTITCLLIALFPLICDWIPGIYHRDETCAYFTGILCLLVIGYEILNRSKKHIFSTLDLAVLLLFIYMTAHYYFHERTQTDPAVMCKWGMTLVAYMLARNLSDKKLIGYALLCSGCLESLTALLQYGGWITSTHTFFSITGHFGNPGPLGGYLAICWIIGFCFLLEKWPKRTMCVGLACILILLSIGILLADSRASFLSIASGIIFYLTAKGHIRLNKQRTCLFLFGIAAFICILYFYRPASARIRLFIWEQTITLITEHPISGHGIGTFPGQYMLHQAQYFQTHPSAPEQLIADNTSSPYNEALHIAVETGIPGLLLSLAVLFFICQKRPNSSWETIVQGALTSWLIFSCFSYPFSVLPLLLILGLLVGSSAQSRYFVFPSANICAPILFCALTFASWKSIRLGYFYHQTSQNMKCLYSSYNQTALQHATQYYELLKNNPLFNATYLYWLARHSNNIQDRQLLENIVPTSESYCLLGDYYQRINLSDKAEETYQTAYYMIPTRMMSTYKLWKLYTTKNDTINAIRMARRLSTQPVKTNNSFNINIRRKAKEFINALSATPNKTTECK